MRGPWYQRCPGSALAPALDPLPGLSLLIGLNFNHRGTENTENTEGGALLGWKEGTEAAFGREIDSIYSPRTRRTSVFSVPLW